MFRERERERERRRASRQRKPPGKRYEALAELRKKPYRRATYHSGVNPVQLWETTLDPNARFAVGGAVGRTLIVTKVDSNGNAGDVGIATNNIETNTALVGAANSMTGLYIGDGSLLFNNTLNRDGGYYISTSVNALNAGPVSLGTTMTLDGTWVIV